MKIEFWPISRLAEYPRNARKITDKAVEKVAASLRQFGWRQPIVVDAEGEIIAGHTRLRAAARNGETKVPVHIATDLSPEQVRQYRLMDNRSHDEAKWDFEMLASELKDLQDLDMDLDVTGFEDFEIDPLLAAEWNPKDLALDELTDDEHKREAPPAPVAPAAAPAAAAAPQAPEAPAERISANPEDVVKPEVFDGPNPNVYTPSIPVHNPADLERPELKAIYLTAEQYDIVDQAWGELRDREGDQTISIGRALELISGDYLAGA